MRSGWERAKAIGDAFRARFDRLVDIFRLAVGRSARSESLLSQVHAAQRAFAQKRMEEFNGATPQQIAATNAMVQRRLAEHASATMDGKPPAR